MSYLDFGDIVLSESESRTLISNLRNPNKSYLKIRDRLFDEVDCSFTIRAEGTDFVVDIPGLDLSGIENEKMVSATVECDEDEFYIYSIHSTFLPDRKKIASFSFEWNFSGDSLYGVNSYPYKVDVDEDKINVATEKSYGVAA